MRNKPLHINIASYSGGGKTTMIRELKKRLNVFIIPRITCRPPRELEEEIGQYKFVTKKEFEEMYARGDLLSRNVSNLNGEIYYRGIPRVELWPNIPEGVDLVVSDFGLSNVHKVKEVFPEMKLFFIDFKDKNILDKRLKERCLKDNSGYDTKHKNNLEYFKEDVKSKHEYVVYNDTTIEDCVEQILTILKK